MSNKLLPSTQRAAMISAIIENPVAEVRDAQGAVITGGASNTRSISVNVYDFISGTGWLELWQGIPTSGGTLLAVNNVHSDAVRHTYIAADTGLGVFANLPEGQLTIRAIDQGVNLGSESEVSFSV